MSTAFRPSERAVCIAWRIEESVGVRVESAAIVFELESCMYQVVTISTLSLPSAATLCSEVVVPGIA